MVAIHPSSCSHACLHPLPLQVLLLLQEEKEKIASATQVSVGASTAQDPQAGVQEAGSVLGGVGFRGPHARTISQDLGSLPSHRTLVEMSTRVFRRPLREH